MRASTPLASSPVAASDAEGDVLPVSGAIFVLTTDDSLTVLSTQSDIFVQ